MIPCALQHVNSTNCKASWETRHATKTDEAGNVWIGEWYDLVNGDSIWLEGNLPKNGQTVQHQWLNFASIKWNLTKFVTLATIIWWKSSCFFNHGISWDVSCIFSRMPWGIALALGVIFKKDGECDRSQACKPNVCSEKVFKQVIRRAGYGPHVPSKWLVFFFWIMWYVYIDTMRSMSTAEFAAQNDHLTLSTWDYYGLCIHFTTDFAPLPPRFSHGSGSIHSLTGPSFICPAASYAFPFEVLGGACWKPEFGFECTYFALKIWRLRDVENEIFIGTHVLRKHPFEAMFFLSAVCKTPRQPVHRQEFVKLGWSNIRKVWLDGNFLTGTIPVSWLIGRTSFGKEELVLVNW